ncbi:MAG: polyprenyl synthetase family protein [Candidatus Micrarchaeota archaeon]
MELYPHISKHLSQVERIMANDLEKEDARVFGLLLPFIKRGGKRIRPALSLLSCSAAGGKYEDMLAPAAIIELFHNFTLIHDDIEDDSKFRRGEPTLHVSHGIPIALNSGDALYTLLWKRLILLKIPPKSLIALQALYAEAFKRVVEGQGIELSWIKSGRFDVTEENYLHMINGKTSALMGLSCEAGAAIARAPMRTRRALRSYGEKIGAAFQIQDDVLNLIGDFKKYKKEIGGDISEGKRTLMVVHFLKHARAQDRARLVSILSSHSNAKEDISWTIEAMRDVGSIDYARECALRLVEEAKAELKRLPESADRTALESIATYVITRER